jgi:isopenicillin-N N-acyltransferase-like protein
VLRLMPGGAQGSGLPLYFNVRLILESASLGEAVNRLRASDRDRPNNLTVVSPEGPAHLEVTCQSVGVLRPAGDGEALAELRAGTMLHTNHYLHPSLEHMDSSAPEIIQSRPRLARATALAGAGGRGGRFGAEDLKRLLRDHDGHPRSICRHPNPDAETGEWTTVLSAVMDVSGGVMHCSRGPPCCNEYVLYSLGARPSL